MTPVSETTQPKDVLEPLPVETSFDVGRVLRRSLSAWACNVLPFTAIAALVYAPILAYAFWALGEPRGLERSESVDRWLLLGPLVLEPIVAGLIAKAVLRQHRGRPTGVLEAVREAARELLPLLGVTAIGAMIVALGIGALILPGILLYFAYFVAGPVAVIERPGIYPALTRSAALTARHRWKLFQLVALVGIANYGASKLLLSAAESSTTISDVKLYVAIYYLIVINVVTVRAVVRAASYVELTRGAEPPARD